MVKVISTAETRQQMQQDMPELQRLHEEAMRNEPTWSLFGGELTIDGRKYQVVDAPK